MNFNYNTLRIYGAKIETAGFIVGFSAYAVLAAILAMYAFVIFNLGENDLIDPVWDAEITMYSWIALIIFVSGMIVAGVGCFMETYGSCEGRRSFVDIILGN